MDHSEIMSTMQVLQYLQNFKGHTWCGDMGHTDVPCTRNPDWEQSGQHVWLYAPVKETISFADGRQDQEIERGDLAAFIETAIQTGWLEIPHLMGSTYVGSTYLNHNPDSGLWSAFYESVED